MQFTIPVRSRYAAVSPVDIPEETPTGDRLRAAVVAAVGSGADLRGADLRGADLTGAYLTGAYLTGAYLTGAYLRGADLRGAYLTGADLRGAYLTGADLTGADLTGAYLTGADLRGADLRGAYLRGAYLTGAYLTGAYLRGAYLRGADLTGAYLRGAYLTGADLRGHPGDTPSPSNTVSALLAQMQRVSDGYTFNLFKMEEGPAIITAGCRCMSIEEYRAHTLTYGSHGKRVEVSMMLDYLANVENHSTQL